MQGCTANECVFVSIGPRLQVMFPQKGLVIAMFGVTALLLLIYVSIAVFVPHQTEAPFTDKQVAEFEEIPRLPRSDKEGLKRAFREHTPVVVEGLIPDTESGVFLVFFYFLFLLMVVQSLFRWTCLTRKRECW